MDLPPATESRASGRVRGILLSTAMFSALAGCDSSPSSPSEKALERALIQSTPRAPVGIPSGGPQEPRPSEPVAAPAPGPPAATTAAVSTPAASPDEVRKRLAEIGVEFRHLGVWFEREGTTILALKVAGTRAPETWKQLRAEVPRLGRWPVVIGPEPGEAGLPGIPGPGDTVAKALREAKDKDGARVLAERAELLESEEDEDAVEPRGKWPEGARHLESISLHRDLRSGEPRSEVTVALVPTVRGHEVPAWLWFGAWNDCPTPEEHVAVLRDWETRFGVELACLGFDTMELVGARPPSGRKALIALAREQYHYCSDLVEQEMDTVDALAARLEKSTVWWFWWD